MDIKIVKHIIHLWLETFKEKKHIGKIRYMTSIENSSPKYFLNSLVDSHLYKNWSQMQSSYQKISFSIYNSKFKFTVPK